MAAPTELKDSLQRISALMGLLRSDLLELSQTRDTASRTPVVDHIHWIADQLDEVGDGLSDDGRKRSAAKPHRSAPTVAKRSTSAKPNARGHSASRHSSPSHAAPGHASARAPLSTRRPAHPDAAHPARRRHTEPPLDEPDAPPADDPTQTASPAEVPSTPPLPDVPSMPGDDKLH